MKKVKKIIVFVMIMVLMAGCTMKENITLTITSDKNFKVAMVVAMDNEMIDAMLSMGSSSDEESSSNQNKTYTDKDRWAFLESDNSSLDLPKDFKIEKYDKEGFKGYLATKELGSIDKVSNSSAAKRVNILQDSDESSAIFDGVLFIKNGEKYKSNMTVDMGEESSQIESYKTYGAMFNIQLIIELPVKPISNNATSVSEDGKTLTYDLLKTKDIDFEFDLSSSNGISSNLVLYIGIGGGILALIVIILLLKKKKNQPKSTQSGEFTQQPQSVPPTQPVDFMQQSQPVSPTQPVDFMQQPQSVPPTQPVDFMQQSQSVPPTQPVDFMQQSQPVSPTQPVEFAQQSQPVSPTQPAEFSQQPQPVQQSQLIEQSQSNVIQNSDNINN